MPTTILGPGDNFPYPTYPTLVQVKKKWSDTWDDMPALTLETASRNAGGNDLDQASFAWKYGQLAQPWDESLRNYDPLDLHNYWVRILLVGPQALQEIWIGRIYGEGRAIQGDQNGPSGIQRWQAYGPQMILRKQAVSRSLWPRPADQLSGHEGLKKTCWVEWLASMNDRVGHQSWLVGNRSDEVLEGAYYHGGTRTWDAYEYLLYILHWFADFSADDGPVFKLGGQAELLKFHEAAHHWPDETRV